MMDRNIFSTAVGLFFLLSCIQVQRALCNQTAITSASINDQITETIVPPYRTAYTTLNDDIVKPLLVADTESNQATIRTLISSLLRAAKNVHDNLHNATEASERLRITADEQITQLVLSISNQEKQVQQSQETVNQANGHIHHAQHQVNVVEAAVRDSQHSLNVANHAVHQAHEAVKNARTCGVGRRKKRFLGSFLRELNPVRIFRNVVGKPLCSVINSGGIDRAKERRTLAEQTLHQSQQRLQSHQHSLAVQRTQYDTAQAQLNAANIQLQLLTSELNEQRAKQLLVSSLTEQIKTVEEHLNNVLGSSSILLDEMTRLIDFKHVIQPLNNIYEEMVKNNIMQSFGFEISAETTQQINANLQKLTKKMPKMSLNAIVATNSEEADAFDLEDYYT